jgi:hypothetical protein
MSSIFFAKKLDFLRMQEFTKKLQSILLYSTLSVAFSRFRRYNSEYPRQSEVYA